MRSAGAAGALVVLAAGIVGAPLQAQPDARVVAAVVAAPGLVHETWVVPGASAAVHVARRDAGSPVRLRLVQAHDGIGRGLETPSAMCRRTRGCRIAVNGDFFTPSGAPVGAVVVDGRMLRSPRPDHEQLSLDPLRVSTGGLDDGGWSGEVQRGADRPPLRLSGVNVGRAPGQLVLYTSDFGAGTPACTCVEVRLAEQEGAAAGALGRPVPVTIAGRGAGASPLGAGTAVLAGDGAAGEALQELLDAPVPLVLWVTTTAPTAQSVGVHPVLLRDGQPTAYDRGDPMLGDPHPRTLVGWDARGRVWLVAAEGRAPGAPGLTAAQAVSFLQSLGATEAVMLDGGGSTSFVAGGRAVSRPSDGRERPVANALVLTWAEPVTMAARTSPAASPVPVPSAAAAAPKAPAVTPSVAPAQPVRPPPTEQVVAEPPAAEPPPRTVTVRRTPPAGEPVVVSPAVRAAATPAEVGVRAPTAVATALLAVALGLWLSLARPGVSSRRRGRPARAAAHRRRRGAHSR